MSSLHRTLQHSLKCGMLSASTGLLIAARTSYEAPSSTCERSDFIGPASSVFIDMSSDRHCRDLVIKFEEAKIHGS